MLKRIIIDNIVWIFFVKWRQVERLTEIQAFDETWEQVVFGIMQNIDGKAEQVCRTQACTCKKRQ